MKKFIISIQLMLIVQLLHGQGSGAYILKHLKSVHSSSGHSSQIILPPDSLTEFVPVASYQTNDTDTYSDLKHELSQLKKLHINSSKKGVDSTANILIVNNLQQKIDSLARLVDSTKVSTIKKDYKTLEAALKEIEKGVALFNNDTVIKYAADTFLVLYFARVQSKMDSDEVEKLTLKAAEFSAIVSKLEFILEPKNYKKMHDDFVELISKSHEVGIASQELTISITKRRNEFAKLVNERKKTKEADENANNELTSMPNVIVPLTSSQVIPSLNILGSRVTTNEKSAASHSFLLYMAKDFTLKTDSTPSGEIYKKATTNLFIPEASTLGVMYKYTKAFFFNETPEKNVGVITGRVYLLNKLLPQKSDNDTAEIYKGVKNNVFFHFKLGAEYYIAKNIFHLYANLNGFLAINETESYEKIYALSSNKLITYLDAGASISLVSQETKNDFAIQLGMVFQNSNIKSFTRNNDVGIPTLKFAYTFDKLY